MSTPATEHGHWSSTVTVAPADAGREAGPGAAPHRRGPTAETRKARPGRDHRGRLRLVSGAAMVAGAGLVTWSAAIHLHLWMVGYRHIPTIGPLFLFQSIGGFLIAAAIAGTRRVIPALIGMAFLASTIGGLLLSAWVGLFGFHDGLNAPFAGMSLVVEAVGIAVLAGAGGLRIMAARH